ncbi:hypothetical protein F4818DRAFT_189319 [Hypoxylon cercidicola]|nr:hypothetical protein F4818DRAFT_189319 [Hypoxylon cercidicola]
MRERRSKLACLPRSRSTSSMPIVTNGFVSASGDDLRDDGLHREQPGGDSLQELTEFVRTTGPSESRLGACRQNDAKRWSIKSLRKEWRARTHAQSMSHLPPNTVPGRTVDGHHYVVISLPSRHEHFPRSRSRFSQSSSGRRLELATSRQEWPERTSSGRGWSRPLAPVIPAKTLSRIIRSDNVPRRQSSVERAGMPTSNPPGDVPGCELTAPDERITVSRASIDGNATAAQRQSILNRELKSSRQSGSDYPEPSSTSQQSLSLDPNTIAQSTLAAPLDTLLPESPGFPKMLAAMTFPCPPTRSRPSSPDRSADLVASCPTPLTIRPRTSSKRAPTSNSGAPTASLDELVMQSTCPILSHLKADDNSCASEGFTASSSAQEIEDVKSKPSSETSSAPIEAGCNSVTSTASNNANSARQSLQSNITTRASSPLTPPTTNESYNLLIQSPTAGMQLYCPTASEIPSGHKVTMDRHLMYTPSISNSALARPAREESSTSMGPARRSCGLESNYGSAMGRLTSISTDRNTDSRRSIVERRIARKIKVQAYKKRDLDAAGLFENITGPDAINIDSNDSPVLGWFPSVSYPRELPTQTNELVISHVMNSEISPGEYSSHISRPPMTVNEINISPIIVVSDIEPLEESTTIHRSAVYSPTTCQPTRPARKHQLRIMAQSNQKSIPITIHRNPGTGNIQRTMSTTNKPNRHSLTSIPLSINIPSLKRRSHPVGNARNDSPTTPTMIGDAPSKVAAPVQRNTAIDEYKNEPRALSRKERVQKEKLLRNEEITKLVSETRITPNRQDETKRAQDSYLTQEIESRLQKLEENKDAWLEVIESLLNNMSKTLEELRDNNYNERLTKREFSIRVNSFKIS